VLTLLEGSCLLGLAKNWWPGVLDVGLRNSFEALSGFEGLRKALNLRLGNTLSVTSQNPGRVTKVVPSPA